MIIRLLIMWSVHKMLNYILAINRSCHVLTYFRLQMCMLQEAIYKVMATLALTSANCLSDSGWVEKATIKRKKHNTQNTNRKRHNKSHLLKLGKKIKCFATKFLTHIYGKDSVNLLWF